MPERNYTHIRIIDPEEFDPRSFRVITLSPGRGIKATIGCPAGEWDARKNKCIVGTRIQKFLYPKPAGDPGKLAQHVAEISGHPVAVPLDLEKEAEMYRRFHHRKPDAVIKTSHPAVPRALVVLGRLESVIYRKDGQAYIHDLKHGVLAADRKGKLYIIGDKAKITKRGIEG